MDGVVDPASGLLHADAPPLGLFFWFFGFCAQDGQRERVCERERENKKFEVVEVEVFEVKRGKKKKLPPLISLIDFDARSLPAFPERSPANSRCRAELWSIPSLCPLWRSGWNS